MGLWDDLWKPMPFPVWKLNEMRGKLVSALNDASGYLEIAEYFVNDADRLSAYRSKINEVSNVLSLPDTVVKNYLSAVKIIQAVSDLRGDIRKNPQRSAKAFGKLFSGIGELAQYLPFPVNTYLEIFAGAEDFFENIRANMDMSVHFREPGIRETIDNL